MNEGESVFLSRRRLPLATLLYEQFINLTKITLRPNIQLLNKYAYQSFDTICNIVTSWVNFRKKNGYMNMNYNYPTTIYRSIFTQMFKFLVETYTFTIFALLTFQGHNEKKKQCSTYQRKCQCLVCRYQNSLIGKQRIINNTRNTYIWVKILILYCSQIIYNY